MRSSIIFKTDFYISITFFKSILKKFIKFFSGYIILYKKFGVGQFDADGNLIREFRSKHHCQETLKFGEKTMCKAIETGTGVTLLSGTTAYFKYLSDKLSI